MNAFGKKNYLGSFSPPFAVINDFAFLRDPFRARLALGDFRGNQGCSRARSGVFRSASSATLQLLAARDADAMERLVRRSARLHLAHVATGGDPFELGSSRPLDFGHWAAHKLEQMTGHRLRHGEAVAIGIALDSSYAYRRGFLAEQDWRRILDLLVAVGFDLLGSGIVARPRKSGCGRLRSPTGSRSSASTWAAMLTIMLLRGIGQPFDVHEIDRDAMIRSIELVATAQEKARSGGTARRAS